MVVAGVRGWSRPVVHVTPVAHREEGLPPWEVAALVLVVDPYRELPFDAGLVEAALDL